MRTKKNGYGLAALAAAAFGLLSNLQAQTISAWTNAVNGNWSDAGAWSAAGVPNANMAHLTNYLASYAVTYDSVNPAFKDLRIENTGSQKTDLLISAPLVSNGGAAFRFRRGSRVTVNPGGVWRFDGATNTVTDSWESMLSIRDGGELNIAGGTVAFTNLPNASGKGNFINVGHLSAGTLNVTGGTLSYYETYPRAVTNDNRGLRVGWDNNGDGTLNISGGNVQLGKNQAYTDQTLMSVGYGNGPGTGTRGKVVVSGGTLQFTNSLSWSLLVIGRNGGHGTFAVTNTGYVRLNYATGGRVQLGVSPTAYGLLRMDGGYLWANDGITAGYSLNYKNNWTTGAVEVTAGTMNAGSGFVIGYGESNAGDQNTAAYGTGVGTATIGGGRVAEDYWGTFIGRARRGGEGIGSMTITNGLFDIVSSADPEATGGAAGNGAYSGLAIGCINFNETNPYTRARGTLTVAGSGIITNAGFFSVGINGGTGIVTQTGGKIVHAPSGGVSDRKMTVIGYNFGASAAVGGGYGSYEMSGGTFYTPKRAFVGGVPTSVLSYALPGSTGLLKVNGGSFTVTNNTLMVGGNGAGTLVIGSNGVCFAKDIVLTNNTQSTLRFELGAAGSGILKASGNLAIAPGAKLEVDAKAYQGSAVWVKLADCATRTTSFAPSNITVTGNGVVRQDVDEDIWLYVQRGTFVGIY